LLEQLHECTEPRLEAESPLLSPGADERTYTRHLAKLWGFHAPVERDLAKLPELARVGLLLDERRKCPTLAADLLALGYSRAGVASLPRCPFSPRLVDVPSALGCLYVLEGATLGGQVLFRELGRTMPDTMRTASRYLRIYGSVTGARWQEFTAILAQFSGTARDEARVLAAASDTFAAIRRWLVERPAPRSERTSQGAPEHG
jgi:heme oxygenase